MVQIKKKSHMKEVMTSILIDKIYLVCSVKIFDVFGLFSCDNQKLLLFVCFHVMNLR